MNFSCFPANIGITESAFPTTLADAVAIVDGLPGCESESASMTAFEVLRAEREGYSSSADVVVAHWGFQRIAARWCVLDIRGTASVFRQREVVRLRQDFSHTIEHFACAKDANLRLNDASETSDIRYLFEMPAPGQQEMLAWVPGYLLADFAELAKRSGLSVAV